jgi:parvulin-like peptidyl-prolyl isomerase
MPLVPADEIEEADEETERVRGGDEPVVQSELLGEVPVSEAIHGAESNITLIHEDLDAKTEEIAVLQEKVEHQSEQIDELREMIDIMMDTLEEVDDITQFVRGSDAYEWEEWDR